MHVAFLYNEFSEDPAAGADLDLPVDFAPADALRRLGHEVTLVAATLDLAALRHELEQAEPDVVFNRVESLGGSDRTAVAVPLLLDAMGLPYTGCPTAALVAADNKLTVKERLRGAGLPTPDWIALPLGKGRLPSPSGRGAGGEGSSRHPHPNAEGDSELVTRHPHLATARRLRRPNPLSATADLRPKREGVQYILKSVFEHGSFNMDDGAVFAATSIDQVRGRIAEQEARWGRPYFAEQFVDGREFNLALLCGRVLPPAEIDFSALPDGQPRIVGQRAKFDAESFEYHHTPRRFDFPPDDQPLVEQMCELAVACWSLFGLEGHVRIDFRCDRRDRPLILEINTNPCLERASGFAAALEEAGIGYDGGIQRLVEDAMARAEGGRGKGEERHDQRPGSRRSSRSPRSSLLTPRSSLPPSALRLPP